MSVTLIDKEPFMQLTAEQRQTALHVVVARLFAIGGERVIWKGTMQDAAPIHEHGHVFDQTPQLRRGRWNRCEDNVARRWATDPSLYTVAMGYALSDRVWRPHRWLVAGTTLIETTTLAEVYYGFELPEELALAFWVGEMEDPARWLDKARTPAKVRPLLLKHAEWLAQQRCSCCGFPLLEPPRHEQVRDGRDGGTRPRSRSAR
jgi:hypothetical protein